MRKDFFTLVLVLIAVLFATIAVTLADPALPVGTWTKISPSDVVMTNENHVFCQGVTLDPKNPSIIYLCICAYDVTKGGLWKTVDGGAHWSKVGQLDEPIHIAVDPSNTKHLYCVDGVRGQTEGFWVSNDAGVTWTTPTGFDTIAKTINCRDLYSVAVDPTDFKHVLVSFHYPWNNSRNCGVLESNDGGVSWVAHNPPDGAAGGYGMDIFFLYDPAIKMGDRNTWLFTAQQGGFFRTTDAGTTWTIVYNKQMTHGGDQLYRTKDGTLYAGAYQYPVRSTDNGLTWTALTNGLVYSWYMGVCGDGQNVYIGCSNENEPFFTSPESDGLTWKPYLGGIQTFSAEPFEMRYNARDHIMYAASWGEGLLALKIK